jgi:hypothetical protein
MANFADEKYYDVVLEYLNASRVARDVTNQNYTMEGAQTATIDRPSAVSANTLSADNQATVQGPSASTIYLVFDQEKDLTTGIPYVQQFQTGVDIRASYHTSQVEAID